MNKKMNKSLNYTTNPISNGLTSVALFSAPNVPFSLIRSNFQAHPFHLVSPSPWLLYTITTLFTLTLSAVLTFHSALSPSLELVAKWPFLDIEFIKSGLVYTIILAIIFTAFQRIKYAVSSFTLSDGTYSSCFYFGTAFLNTIALFLMCLNILFNLLFLPQFCINFCDTLDFVGGVHDYLDIIESNNNNFLINLNDWFNPSLLSNPLEGEPGTSGGSGTGEGSGTNGESGTGQDPGSGEGSGTNGESGTGGGGTDPSPNNNGAGAEPSCHDERGRTRCVHPDEWEPITWDENRPCCLRGCDPQGGVPTYQFPHWNCDSRVATVACSECNCVFCCEVCLDHQEAVPSTETSEAGVSDSEDGGNEEEN